MKKFFVLGIITVLLLSSIYISTDTAKNSVINVDVAVADYSVSNKLINFTGKVKEKNAIETTLNFPVYYKEIIKREGDTVIAGDIIAIIDKEKTVELLRKLDKDNLSEILNNFGITESVISILNGESEMLSDYSEIINEIENNSTNLIAPCDGTVVYSNITGKTLMTSQSCVTVSDRNSMTVETFIPEIRIEEIKVGQAVFISCNAIENKTFTGVVSFISPNVGTNGVKVTIDIDNADNILKYGFEATGSIITKTYSDVITLPYECIIYDGNSQYVYIVSSDRAYKKEVKLLTESLDGCAVTGVNDGEYIITNPQNLTDGQSVKIKSITE